MPRDNIGGASLVASLRQIAQKGRLWAEAEAALARAEVSSDGKRLLVVLVFAAVAFGSLFAAVILLSAFMVSALAPYVSGLANAAGILGLAFLIVAMLLGWRIWSLASQEFGLSALFKRWWNFAVEGQGSKP